MAKCQDCLGTAPFSTQRGDGRCSACSGTGDELNVFDAFSDAISGQAQTCKGCGGSKVCQTCGGSGVTQQGSFGEKQSGREKEVDEFLGIFALSWGVLLLLSPFLIVAAAFVLPMYMLKWMISGRAGYGETKNRSLLVNIGIRLGKGYLGVLALMASIGLLSLAAEGIEPYFSGRHFPKSDWFEMFVLVPLAILATTLWIFAFGIAGTKLIIFGRFYARNR